MLGVPDMASLPLHALGWPAFHQIPKLVPLHDSIPAAGCIWPQNTSDPQRTAKKHLATHPTKGRRTSSFVQEVHHVLHSPMAIRRVDHGWESFSDKPISYGWFLYPISSHIPIFTPNPHPHCFGSMVLFGTVPMNYGTRNLLTPDMSYWCLVRRKKKREWSILTISHYQFHNPSNPQQPIQQPYLKRTVVPNPGERKSPSPTGLVHWLVAYNL